MLKACSSHGSILKLILFIASIAAFYYVDAAFAVYDTASCDSCLDNNYVTCRSKHNNSISYCCDPADPNVANCTSLPGNANAENYDRCSTEVPTTMMGVVCPFLHKTCSNSFLANSSDIHVSPQVNDYTVISGSFSDYADEECYYQVYAWPYQHLLSNDYDFQIDVNITQMQGVKAKLHNGTFIYWADDETQANYQNGYANFTYNATISTKGSIYLPEGTYLNNVFVQFETDPDYTDGGNRFFQALVGIRPFNKTVPDDDDDLIIPDAIDRDQPIHKHLTFPEKVIIGTFIFGILVFAIRKSYCVQLEQTLKKWLWKRLERLGCQSGKKEEELKANLAMGELIHTEDWNKVKRMKMIAEEAEANFDELDEHGDNEESSGIDEDEKVTPWAITDDEKTPGAFEKMKNYEEEIKEIAYDCNIEERRKYGEEALFTDRGIDPETPARDSARVRLINESFENAEEVGHDSDSLRLNSKPRGTLIGGISKQSSKGPFEAAHDAEQSTRFQGRATSLADAKKEQDRLRQQVLELEETNRQQEAELLEWEKKNEALAHTMGSPKKSILGSAAGQPTAMTQATTAKKSQQKSALPRPGSEVESMPSVEESSMPSNEEESKERC